MGRTSNQTIAELPLSGKCSCAHGGGSPKDQQRPNCCTLYGRSSAEGLRGSRSRRHYHRVISAFAISFRDNHTKTPLNDAQLRSSCRDEGPNAHITTEDGTAGLPASPLMRTSHEGSRVPPRTIWILCVAPSSNSWITAFLLVVTTLPSSLIARTPPLTPSGLSTVIS